MLHLQIINKKRPVEMNIMTETRPFEFNNIYSIALQAADISATRRPSLRHVYHKNLPMTRIPEQTLLFQTVKIPKMQGKK